MPHGSMMFDETGVATEGTLEHDGTVIDMRSNDLVAILVSRHAIEPRQPDNDQAVRIAVLSALRSKRLVERLWRWVPTAILLVLLWTTWQVFVVGYEWTVLIVPALMVVLYWTVWILDRRRMRR